MSSSDRLGAAGAELMAAKAAAAAAFADPSGAGAAAAAGCMTIRLGAPFFPPPTTPRLVTGAFDVFGASNPIVSTLPSALALTAAASPPGAPPPMAANAFLICSRVASSSEHTLRSSSSRAARSPMVASIVSSSALATARGSAWRLAPAGSGAASTAAIAFSSEDLSRLSRALRMPMARVTHLSAASGSESN